MAARSVHRAGIFLGSDRFPLYRIDLGSLAKAGKNVEAAVEAFLENLFNNEPAVGKAPARSNANR